MAKKTISAVAAAEKTISAVAGAEASAEVFVIASRALRRKVRSKILMSLTEAENLREGA